jgi:hypothetical protein
VSDGQVVTAVLLNLQVALCGQAVVLIKSRIAMAKTAFNKKKNFFTSKLDLI